jgi:Protein of unknown function (DUF3800)
VHVFVDDSGSFSWATPGISLFCGLMIPDRDLANLCDRFEAWKRLILGNSRRELKGDELTSNQLESFSYKVLPLTDRDPRLSVVGTDTRVLSQSNIEKYRDQSAKLLHETSKYVEEHNPGNHRLRQQYLEMAGWVRNRSAVNTLWIDVIEALIHQTLQHMIAFYMEPEDDTEFQNIDFIIDESFIRRDEHIAFWKEWLRNGLVNRFNRFGALALPESRSKREHSFVRKYKISGDLLEMRDLFQNHVNFAGSEAIVGLQIADICAHICYRFHRGERDLKAYWNLAKRIAGQNGRSLTLVLINEDSLIREGEDFAQYVHPLSQEELKVLAATRDLDSSKKSDA